MTSKKLKSNNNAWTRLGTETQPTKPFPEKVVFGTKEDEWSVNKYTGRTPHLVFGPKEITFGNPMGTMGTAVFYDGRGATPWHGVRCIDPVTGQVMESSEEDSERVQLVFYSRTRVDRCGDDTDPHGHVAQVRKNPKNGDDRFS